MGHARLRRGFGPGGPGQGVTVACLCPGGIDTPLWDATTYPGDRTRLMSVAEAALFLLDRSPGTTCKRLVLSPENEWH